jgi:hypothetical protein
MASLVILPDGKILCLNGARLGMRLRLCIISSFFKNIALPQEPQDTEQTVGLLVNHTQMIQS